MNVDTKNKINTELIILLVILLIAGIAHGFNMFNFPFYENDEGTYMSRAWALVTYGRLSPYTYTYDMTPVGWMLIALWAKLTGGFFAFGFAINSGRVLMLLVQLVSVALLFYIAKQLTDNLIIASTAALIFSLTPLGIFFHRRVLVENIMVMWLLVSFALLLLPGKRLSAVMLSGITFSLALVTREVAIVFLPAYMFILFSEAHPVNRPFFIGLWFVTAACLPVFYLLYSLIQKEFFPPYTFLGGNYLHVSLLETTSQQLSDSFTLQTNLSNMLRDWASSEDVAVQADPLLIVGGIVCGAIAGIYGLSKQRIFYPFITSITYWVFLLLTGAPSGHLIIPIIPFLVLNVAAVMDFVFNNFTRGSRKLSRLEPLIAGFVLLPVIVAWFNAGELYTLDITARQEEAVAWMKQNVDGQSIILTDNYAYLDLQVATEEQSEVFPNAVYYWTVDSDPEIRDGLLSDNWERVDYVLTTPQTHFDAETYNLSLVQEALDNSNLLIQYTNGGWPIEVRSVGQPEN